MGVLSKVAGALEAGAKALRRGDVRWPGQPMMWFDLDRPPIRDIAREIGDGTEADVIMTPIRWIQRAAVEAPLVALDREDNPAPDSELQRLLDKPSEWYGLDHLVQATAFDIGMSGDAYWLMAENGNGRVAELTWVPQLFMEPRWPGDGSEYITHYEYTAGGHRQDIEPRDVIHFRLGVDPRNIRKGLSPLRGLMREIWTDQEAAAFTAALLRNGAVPGLVLSPATPEHKMQPGEADAAEAKINTKLTRNGRGRPIVLPGPTKLQQFGFNPKDLDLSALRDVSEERVCAALGVAAAVVGFGAGLQTTKVGATMDAMERGSYRNGVVPLWRIMQRAITRSLVPRLRATASSAKRASFDFGEVEALQEDSNQKSARTERELRSGIITRREARIELGFNGGDEGGPDDVYLMQLSTLEIPRNVNGQRAQIVQAQLEERRLLMAGEVKHDGTLTEQRLADTSPLARVIPDRVRRFASAVDRIRREAPVAFGAELETIFERLGEEAERVALRLLEERGELEERSAAWRAAEMKQDDELLREILDQLDAVGVEDELRAAFSAYYLSIAAHVADQLAARMAIEFIITDPVQVEILRRAGLRVGLIDLDAQIRDALFDALAEGRAEGLAGEGLARRIREHVSAGRFTSGTPEQNVARRALLIARTEAGYAANVATIMAAREMDDTEHMICLDNRTNYAAEDPDHDICARLNGRVFTLADAEVLAVDEHPNGTRSLTPVNGLLLEEMGLAVSSLDDFQGATS